MEMNKTGPAALSGLGEHTFDDLTGPAAYGVPRRGYDKLRSATERNQRVPRGQPL